MLLCADKTQFSSDKTLCQNSMKAGSHMQFLYDISAEVAKALGVHQSPESAHIECL